MEEEEEEHQEQQHQEQEHTEQEKDDTQGSVVWLDTHHITLPYVQPAFQGLLLLLLLLTHTRCYQWTITGITIYSIIYVKRP